MTHTTRKAVLVAAASLLMIVLLVIGLALLTPLEQADSQAVSAANALVEAGNTVEAIEIYESLLDRGAYDSSLYYNLGNAYMVGGQPAAAVLYYERAAALAPRDADIRANLELAAAQAPTVQTPEPTGPLALAAGLTSGWLSLDETAVLVAALWFTVAILMLIIRASGRALPWLGRLAVVLALVMLLFGISLGSRAWLVQTTPNPVVAGEVATAAAQP